MKKRYLIPLILIGLVTARVAWVSRPEPGDHAELTDTCEFNGFPNAKYRALITEAKALLAPHRRKIANEANRPERERKRDNSELPTLSRLALQFLAPSQSTTETMVRLLALARAMDGRPTVSAHVSDYDATYKSTKGMDNVIVSVAFAAPIGTLRHELLHILELRFWGRRSDSLTIAAFGQPYRDYATRSTTTDEMLPGARISRVHASGSNSIDFLNSGFKFGEPHRGNYRCPDIDRHISDQSLLAYGHKKVFAK